MLGGKDGVTSVVDVSMMLKHLLFHFQSVICTQVCVDRRRMGSSVLVKGVCLVHRELVEKDN